jgi:hypothetical protein
VTAFTVAHSITLALAALGFVHVPQSPVEAVIALSIVFVAAEILRARAGHEGIAARAPWVVAFTFGLLHGFGFAGALAEIGLPEGPSTRVFVLQRRGGTCCSAFIAAVLSAIATIRRIRLRFPRWTELVPPYAIGGVAMFWVINESPLSEFSVWSTARRTV